LIPSIDCIGSKKRCPQLQSKEFKMIIFTLTALVRSTHAPWLQAALRAGDVQHAATLAQTFLDGAAHGGGSALTANIAVLCGDLMLAQDRDEDAEDCYRQALKAAGQGARGDVRLLSCRNTGFMNLYQQRFGTAVACFRRVVEDEAAGAQQQVEALCGLAMAHHGMGQKTQALACLDRAAEQTTNGNEPHLVMLTSVLRTELQVQRDIRAHSELQDHVFWQLPSHSAQAAQDTVHPLAAVQAGLLAYEPLPLVARHLEHLRNLILASCGDNAALQRSHEHLSWLRHAHLSALERQARLETALVAIALRNVDMARGLLEPLCGRGAEGGTQRWNFELSYCLARVCALSGRSDESLKHYQRYALESVQCVRAETADPSQGPAQAQPAGGAVKDDVEMALPAKYRRAYRYMLEHLECATLSVREIADEIGVTERALQSVFKAQLGMTPAEVVRRCRVERIRQDLLRGDSAGVTVIETASRWGIRNRSTLVSLYRKYFRETPAQTLSRGAAGASPRVGFAASPQQAA
jgi:AraC-like DNA-binding protein/tetratricopeptide (TPR) repeat protein